MKKILLATTVLAMSATVAAAEVTLSGDARMGVTTNNAARDMAFTSRARLSVAMSGETDGGLSFGASLRADNAAASCKSSGLTLGGLLDFEEAAAEATLEADAAAQDVIDNGGTDDEAEAAFMAVIADLSVVGPSACSGGAVNGTAGSVFISGAFGKLAMGDVDSAANALVGNVSGVGMTGLGDANELGYIGNSGTSVLYTYTAGALSFALSASQPTVSDAKSVAVKYAGEGFSVALGFEDDGADTQTTVGVSGSVGGMGLSLVAADNSGNADMHYAISVDYSADALGVTAFYAEKGDADAYGLGASYNLGGGAKVVGGVSKTKGASAVADLGISMSF